MEYKTPEVLENEAKEVLLKIKGKELSIKERMAIPAQIMPTQEPHERAKKITEVALGYSKDQAIVEASRCLQCKNEPCIKGCPVNVKIPNFIKQIALGNFQGAIDIIKETNLLPAICGRVCPQETQCQGQCTLGKSLKDVNKAVSIGRLERFAADWERENAAAKDSKNDEKYTSKNDLPKASLDYPVTNAGLGKKVAIIGAGPAGLTVASDLIKAEFSVTVFEALHKAGGVMMYGIPEFRLPKAIVEKEINTLEKMGVKFELNCLIGRTDTLDALISEKGFDAVFVGTGAGLPKFLNIPGENLIGVFSANEYLTRANLMKGYDEKADTPIYRAKRVCVSGGGNVAMDAARMALRLGAEEVNVVYRRTRSEMPARVEEIEHAIEEGVKFHFLESPVEVIGDDTGHIKSLKLISFELGEPDASGRRRPVAIAGSEHILDCDALIVALGNESNPLIVKTTPGLESDARHHIKTDDTQKTTKQKVWAGGDIVLGAATVILAMGEGRIAAKSIIDSLGAK